MSGLIYNLYRYFRTSHYDQP